MRCSPLLDRWLVRWGRLGFTDVYHDKARARGVFGQLFLLLFGTPHLGSFANGIYLDRVVRGGRFDSILDAGCGDGTFAFYLASKLPDSRILSVDIGEQGLHGVESTLEICKRVQEILGFANLQFAQADLRQLDFENAFDLIYCFDVLEHIRENKQVLANCHRALKNDGLLLFRIPTRVQKRILGKGLTAEHEKWATVEHLGQHYEKDSLTADLHELGYKVISMDDTMGFWGRLSFELFEGMRTFHFPEAIQFAAVPLLKVFRYMDTLTHPTEGDGLLVLCRK